MGGLKDTNILTTKKKSRSRPALLDCMFMLSCWVTRKYVHQNSRDSSNLVCDDIGDPTYFGHCGVFWKRDVYGGSVYSRVSLNANRIRAKVSRNATGPFEHFVYPRKQFLIRRHVLSPQRAAEERILAHFFAGGGTRTHKPFGQRF